MLYETGKVDLEGPYNNGRAPLEIAKMSEHRGSVQVLEHYIDQLREKTTLTTQSTQSASKVSVEGNETWPQ